MGDKRDILIPAAGLLIFVTAVVFLFWGEQLGVLAFVRSIPPVVGLVIFIAILVISWRMTPALRSGPGGLPRVPGSQGLWPLLIIGLIAFLFFMFVLSQALR